MPPDLWGFPRPVGGEEKRGTGSHRGPSLNNAGSEGFSYGALPKQFLRWVSHKGIITDLNLVWL
jgi:hypothetical protein